MGSGQGLALAHFVQETMDNIKHAASGLVSGPGRAMNSARLSERATWLEGLELADKNRILFELESLLKGLDRFFNVANLPIVNMEQVITLNFVDELEIVQKFVERLVELSGKLLDASRQEDYQFRCYVENKLLGDYERTRWREAVLNQATPPDSLFILFSAFSNIREILKGLVTMKRVPYTLFFNVGSLVTREIVSNRYFNPAGAVEFRPEYDRVTNRRVKRVIKTIDDPLSQRQVMIVILAFNRLLQYLDFIAPSAESIGALKSSLLFFALIHSESMYLMEFMEKNLPAILKDSENEKAAEFLDTCDALSFQLSMEMKKIHAGELLNLSKHQSLDAARSAVENSHGILVNFFQQSMIQLLSVFDPDILGEQVFPHFISRKRMSIKLREDVAVLQSLMDRFEEITETTEAGQQLDTYVKYLLLLKAMAARMRHETLPLMRYQDLVEFEKFIRFIEALEPAWLEHDEKLDNFKMDAKFFKIFVETTLGHINNRTDLQDIPLDEKRVENVLKRFIVKKLKETSSDRTGNAA